jgi:hypothetical protein
VPDADLPAESWVPSLPPDVRFRRTRGKLLAARQDDSVELEDVSADIFSRIDGETSVGALAEAIGAEFDVDRETALADVQEFLAQLVELGILVRDW